MERALQFVVYCSNTLHGQLLAAQLSFSSLECGGLTPLWPVLFIREHSVTNKSGVKPPHSKESRIEIG